MRHRPHHTTKLIHLVGDLIDHVGSLRERPLCRLRADTTECSSKVLQRPGDSLTHALRAAADVTLHRVREGLKVDLAVGHHLGDFGAGLAQLVAEDLQHRNTTAEHLHKVVALKFAAGCDGSEDQAHLVH